MTYDQIMMDLQNKIYHPIYLLMGEESYYIDLITDYIEDHVLDEAAKGFNQTIVYGKDVDARTIDSSAKRFPMMSNYQVVVVKEAQDLKDIDDLVYYAEKPLKSTILVLNYKYKKIPANKKLYKTILKNGVVFDSKKLYDNQVPEWIEKFLRQKKYTISPDASAMLADFLGTDLSKISNELNKLMLILPQGTKIVPSQIEKNIGISKDYNVFELQKAVGKKDILKANRIVNYFSNNPKDAPMVVVVSQLYNYFNKLLCLYFIKDQSKQNVASVLRVNPYFVGEYFQAKKKYSAKKLLRVISILREYDMKSKGVGDNATPQGQLMKEMVYKIMH